jgi:hypothetical protein
MTDTQDLSTQVGSDFRSPESESSSVTPAAVMSARGTILMAFRDAALAMWGEPGLRDIGQRLPDEVRAKTLDVAAGNLDWVPENYVLAWYEAVWHGPCGQQRDAFLKYLDRMLDSGFGRVRKALLAVAKPSMILNRAPSLWQHDHTHGQLTVESLEAHSGKVKLSNHPYTSTSLGCMATAEIYRYCAALCRAREVTAVHYRDPSGALIVSLRWS